MQNTFEDLEDSGCIKMNDDSVVPMMLGSIASKYYLSYMTVSTFGSNIGPDTSLEVSCSFNVFCFTCVNYHGFRQFLRCRCFCIYSLLLLSMMNFLCGIMRYF